MCYRSRSVILALSMLVCMPLYAAEPDMYDPPQSGDPSMQEQQPSLQAPAESNPYAQSEEPGQQGYSDDGGSLRAGPRSWATQQAEPEQKPQGQPPMRDPTEGRQPSDSTNLQDQR